jgi:hypothetical protein
VNRENDGDATKRGGKGEEKSLSPYLILKYRLVITSRMDYLDL